LINTMNECYSCHSCIILNKTFFKIKNTLFSHSEKSNMKNGVKNLLAAVLITSALSLQAQESTMSYVEQHYDKAEHQIEMRDGIKLFTIVYSPKDKSQKYPFLMKRTCYSIGPYGVDDYASNVGPSETLMKEGYIFIYQDVRGRYMSEGTFDNMRPNIPGNNRRNKEDIDESSDTFDTIDWLLKNVKNNNGRVGQWGISYPGYYTAASLPDAHPALRASSPQAPISDFFFDDFHHQGAYLESYTRAIPVFGYQKDSLTTKAWYGDKMIQTDAEDGYEFYLDLGPLKNVDKYYGDDNFFWQQITEHPNYDEFWQKRSILPHLNGIDHAVMTVGGWFDAEDLYGPLNIYKTIEKNNPGTYNTLVMGPWSHGDWSRERGVQAVNDIYFGDSISTFYQTEIESVFFNYHLKDKGENKLPEAYLFDSGIKEWQKFDVWPPQVKGTALYFEAGGKLSLDKPTDPKAVFDYVSDPAKPVPYRSTTAGVVFTPRKFMTDDQRHAARRPDVLTFETDVLSDNITLAGEIMAKLKVAISTTDADFVVKLIDVYPPNEPATKATPATVTMGDYQMLVRSEVFRGRFRNSFENPEPFVPNEPTDVAFPLQDILHTFKKGHKIMIQIQSTWFPYIDRNPQKYVDNIYKANEEDFVKATIQVFGSSVVEVGGSQQMAADIAVK
jgi:putative CocE/NonD family hydrolase